MRHLRSNTLYVPLGLSILSLYSFLPSSSTHHRMQQTRSTDKMPVLKINALLRAMTLVGVFASAALASAAYSDCSSTLPPVTQESGLTTSEGTVLYTWSVCTVVHQTACAVESSIGANAPPPASTGSVETLPSDGQISSYADAEHETSIHGEDHGSLTVPYESAPATGSQPGYSAPPPGATGPGESGEPSVPSETPTAATDTSDSLSSSYPQPTDDASDTGSLSGTGFNPTATSGETAPSGASGTPTVTATGAATMAGAHSAVVLFVVGMIAAIFV
ncbi:hypothetical protein EDB81DRAFT_788262 [Dactylonectria macrodidyma]|uniref:Uncharacterized protein n=1 Tax=Dactylonectria macrodidyma TaxID=307937 RepID=A0A9P9FAP5_9HYPO|nr:hypothetical protein EDB81DRAFT_788262 [Dactylonectria macrodidyma]